MSNTVVEGSMSKFLAHCDTMAGNEAELTCVNIRNGSDFTVDIPWTASIHKMKKLINAELQLTTLPSDLALYLAKPKDSDQWLSPRDPEVRNLRSNVVSDEIQKLLCDELAAGDLVANVVQHAPTSGVIHVLVVPPDASRPSLPSELVEQLQRTFIEGVEKKRKRDEEEAERAKKVKKNIENIVLFAADEYQLDALAQYQVTSTRIVETPGLLSFWKGYGGFPESYLVRKEEVIFWQVVKSMLKSIDDDNWPRIVLVGSPGVGKSCFLMLVGSYLAGFEKHKVIIVRRLKTAKLVNAVVVLDGTGNEIRAEKYTNLTDEQMTKVVHNRTPGTKVLVDGWTQGEMIDVERRLGAYHILATSCQYDKKSDDRSRLVVLPAWHFDDLLHYPRSTNWVIDTGLRQMKNRVAMSTWPKLVKEQHYYSGGSLREFCRERADLVAEVQANCSRVHSDHARDLVFAFGGDQSSRQMDRLRRHYVANPSDPSHYIRNGNWRVAVDSGYALHLLARFVTVAEQAGLYEYAQSVGGGFLGIAYELLLHRAVRQTVLPGSSVIVRMRPNSHYDRIHIDVSSVECRGENEDDCYECIAQLPEATYWHPNYPSFPFIDAVTPCKAYRPGSDESEDVIAYIQVTIQDNKTFKRHRLEQLNEMMDKNTRLSPLNRAYIVVGPNASVCETFTLRDAPPRPDTIVAMVGCFDPQPYVERAKLLSLQPSRSVEAVGQV